MPIRETLKQAGYDYVMYMGDKQHVLYDDKTKTYELWVSNKNHASYGIKWRNTDLEFCSSFKLYQMMQTKKGTFIANKGLT